MLNNDMKFDDICNSILERVFHGTPHDIVGDFDLNKVGTGEGAQAYGWGLYFAENILVANEYAKLSDNIDIGNAPEGLREILRDVFQGANPQEAKEKWLKTYKADADLNDGAFSKNARKVYKYIQTLTDEDIRLGKGNLYSVDIDADKENDFLDWDKKIEEQSDLVKISFENIKKMEATDTHVYKKILDTHGEDMANSFIPEIWKRLGNIGKIADNGKNYYKDLTKAMGYSEKAASELLFKFGIKGIKYLDQGSRGTGEGTYNYVIFDPSIIKIVAKNGEFVMNSKKPENVEI